MGIIQLDIDSNKFQEDLRTRIIASGTQTLPRIIIDLVQEHWEEQLKHLVASQQILRFKIGCTRSPFRSMWPPLSPLPLSFNELRQQMIYDLGCFAVTIVVKSENFAKIRVKHPANLKCLKPIEVKQQLLKTVGKHIIRMHGVGLPAHILLPVKHDFVSYCQCPTECLASHIDRVWDWTLRFVCRVCGKCYFCECFRPALQKHYHKALAERSHYSEDGWPNKFIDAYNRCEFREGICHLCRDIPSNISFCHPMYGSKVMVHYGPYIIRTAIEKDIDKREAENYIRESLGIPRISEGWISEVELLNMVRQMFRAEEVVHQATPEWLGRQRLDIFLPIRKLAIEYQGRQHYEPVALFGGEEGFRERQELDRRKAKICAENGVRLIYFRYNELITPELIKSRLESPS